MIAWIKAQWGQLPHQLQAGITAFSAGVFTMVLTNAMAGRTCLTLACMHERIPQLIGAGASAVAAFYMKPGDKSLAKPPVPPS